MSGQPAGESRRTVALVLLIALTTGLVDAVSVLALGKVFTANMTGNIVFLGLALAGVHGFAVLPFVAAIIAFTAGAWCAGRLAHALVPLGRRNWLVIVAGCEAALLGIAALAGCGHLPGTIAPALVIAPTAVAMGMRNATIRKLGMPDLTGTVLTLTIAGMAADHGHDRSFPRLWRRVGMVAAILLGAMFGALALYALGIGAPLALAGVITLVGTLGLAHDA